MVEFFSIFHFIYRRKCFQIEEPLHGPITLILYVASLYQNIELCCNVRMYCNYDIFYLLKMSIRNTILSCIGRKRIQKIIQVR